MKNSSVHISRAGQIFGTVEAEKIPDYLDSGYLLVSDLYFDEESDGWQPLSHWKAAPASASFRPADGAQKTSHEHSSSRGSRSSSRSGKSRHQSTNVANFAGWVACLFALVAGAGIWAWAQSLNDRLHVSETEAESLKAQVAILKSENQALTEIAPPRHVRGVIAYQMAPGQVGISSGVTVGLYPRDLIEKSLQQVTGSSIQQDFQSLVEGWRTLLPSPTAVTVTDANGRFDLALPDDQPYVLVTTTARRSGADPSLSLWLAGVRASDDPSPLVLLNEGNAITPEEPKFVIKEVRAFQGARP